MAFEFKGEGKVERIDIFTTKNGKNIKTIIVGTDEEYPQLIPIKVFGKVSDVDVGPGDIIEVNGNLGGRDFNGRVFGDIVARYVKIVRKAKPTEEQSTHASGRLENDDPPF